MSRLRMIEFIVKTDNKLGKVSNLSFQIYNGELLHVIFGGCNIKKVGSNTYKIQLLHCEQSKELSPEKIFSLVELEIFNQNNEIIFFESVSNVIIYGEDENGYAIAKKINIPDDAKFISNNSQTRYLVVTGVHGNFKDEKAAYTRASHYKRAKIIRLHA